MMKKTMNDLVDKRIKIAIAESMTGGYVSSLITRQAGASSVFMGAIIAYTKAVKVNILKVDESLIDKYSSVSLEVVTAMNEGLKRIIDAELYISVTGNAGPTYEENTNELKCYILIEYDGKKHFNALKFESKNRFKNIKRTALEIASIIREII